MKIQTLIGNSLSILACIMSLNACSSESVKGLDLTDTNSIKRYIYNEISDPEEQHIEPFQIFDNVYFVGINFVSAYVIKTSEGLILIDSLFDPYVEEIPKKIRRLGLDPEDIKYVIVTHGHFDHVGGASYFQKKYKSQVVMSEAGYKFTQRHAEESAMNALNESDIRDNKYLIQGKNPFLFEAPEKNWVATDQSMITLGDTTVKFHLTPGHTEGTLSMEFDVKQGEKTHRAFVVGGIGIPFEGGVKSAQQYIDSVEKISKISKQTPQISVNLSNHPKQNQLLERKARLKDLNANTHKTHPFVDPDGFDKFINKLRDTGRIGLKMAREQSQ